MRAIVLIAASILLTGACDFDAITGIGEIVGDAPPPLRSLDEFDETPGPTCEEVAQHLTRNVKSSMPVDLKVEGATVTTNLDVRSAFAESTRRICLEEGWNEDAKSCLLASTGEFPGSLRQRRRDCGLEVRDAQ